MKLDVTLTKTTRETVNIDPRDVILRVRDYFMKDMYINKDGYWEVWYDVGHGTGVYKVFDKATNREIEISEAFKIVLDCATECNKEWK